jgi:hypothetical protein
MVKMIYLSTKAHLYIIEIGALKNIICTSSFTIYNTCKFFKYIISKQCVLSMCALVHLTILSAQKNPLLGPPTTKYF